MIKSIRLFKCFAIALLYFLSFSASAQDQYVRLDNKKILDPQGQPLTMHAVSLGGWLLWEGWIWGGGLTKETVIKERLLKLLGKEAYTGFVKKYYDNYITEKDIALIAQSGFNCIRLPFNYRIFDTAEEDQIKGFEKIDEVISWCKKYHIYLVLDMHAAPGGQNSFFISDNEKVKLWDSETDKQRTYKLWTDIAERYKNEPIIAGYDLLNEPDVSNVNTLTSFYTELVKNIRAVDTHHLLIIEGNKLASTFKGFPVKFDDNQVYSYHYYPWFVEKSKAKHLKSIMETLPSDAPVWCGEWGEDTPPNLNDIKNLFVTQQNLAGTSFWTWKRVYKDNNRHTVYSITHTPNWDRIASWLTWQLFKPNAEQTRKGIDEFLNAMRIENCKVEVVY